MYNKLEDITSTGSTTPSHMGKWGKVKVIIFDADDTLWDCQSHFDQVEKVMHNEVSKWCNAEDAHKLLIETETRNVPLTGFGCKAFTLSLIETAIKASHGEIDAERIDHLIKCGYSLLEIPVKPLPGVRDTLEELNGYRRVVFTKGDLRDQANKLKRSGLEPFFEHIEITSDKSKEDYVHLCRKLNVIPEEAIMVGNSFKSDIAPALEAGMKAVYIPFDVVWQLEHSDEYLHPNLIKIKHFKQLAEIINS